VIDITNPSTPLEVGSYAMPGIAYGVTVSGSIAYVAYGESGLRVIDITIPSAPTEVGFYDTQGYAHGVAVIGNIAYLADYTYFGIYDCSEALGVDDRGPEVMPQTVTLHTCYPNPFNPATTIRFDLPQATRAVVSVYDVTGRLVNALTDDLFTAGEHAVRFDGSGLSSGIYFARLQAGNFAQSTKLILLK
jgi:hypothetical protein